MVLTLLTNKIDLQLTEKQSMAQIVCNELAQLTWQSSSDLFVYRLTHLRDLSESWQKFDASQTNNAVLSVVTSPSTANMEESTNAVEKPVQSIPSKAGIITRSKNNIGPKLTPRRRAWDEDYASTKKKTRGKRKVSCADSVETKQREEIILKTEVEGSDSEQQPADDNVAPDGDSELVETGEPEGDEIASNGSVEMSSENVDSGGLSEKTMYSCTECEHSCRLLSSLFRHVRNVHSASSTYNTSYPPDEVSSAAFSCQACGRSFTSKLELLIHRAVHRPQEGSMKQKVTKRTGDGGGTCPVCYRTFLYKRCLLKHQQQVCLLNPVTQPNPVVEWLKLDESAAREIDEARSFLCTECENTFDSLDDLCWHIRVHGLRMPRASEYSSALETGEFQCTVCERRFETELELTGHIIHNAEVHECMKCDRRIGSALQLRIHMLIHKADNRPELLDSKSKVKSAEGTHVCPICSKASKSASQLSDHMIIHTGLKKHICHICAKQFTRSGQLTRHILSHSGDRRFECSKCDRRFLLRDMLRRHTKAVHEKHRPHLCSLCGRPFAMKHQLRTHMKVHASVLQNC